MNWRCFKLYKCAVWKGFFKKIDTNEPILFYMKDTIDLNIKEDATGVTNRKRIGIYGGT